MFSMCYFDFVRIFEKYLVFGKSLFIIKYVSVLGYLSLSVFFFFPFFLIY